MAVTTNNTISFDANRMDLEQTLFCGQSFAWVRAQDGWFEGVAGPHAVDVRLQEGDLLLKKPDDNPFTPGERTFWHRYFSLDFDYPALQKSYAQNPLLAECVASAPGIRLLRQPFFDTLLCFIISQINHIPRIEGIAQRLRAEFGPPLAGGRQGFPVPQTLAALQPEDLAPLRAGFRAKYMIDAAQRVAAGEVTENALCALEDAPARAMLKKITGVGNKVANCVLLFSLARNNIVPMDVWMQRAMQQRFPEGMPPQAKGSEGIAQQYIFHWARQNISR